MRARSDAPYRKTARSAVPTDQFRLVEPSGSRIRWLTRSLICLPHTQNPESRAFSVVRENWNAARDEDRARRSLSSSRHSSFSKMRGFRNAKAAYIASYGPVGMPIFASTITDPACKYGGSCGAHPLRQGSVIISKRINPLRIYPRLHPRGIFFNRERNHLNTPTADLRREP
jgi:hypothetical protein